MRNCKKINHKEINEFYVCDNADQAILMAGDNIIEIVKSNPRAKITYATGNTKIPLYEYIAKKIEAGEVDFSQTTAFHLDEYFPISPDHQDSFVNYLNKRVFKPFQIKPENIHVLDGNDPNYQKTCDNYNKWLKGGVDLCILGIGPGSHIGFNESGTAFDSVTHLVELSPETVYRDQIERGQNSPPRAISQGIANILEAKKIILSAFGSNNIETIYNAFFKKISRKYPASALRKVGGKVSVIIDKQAGGNLLNVK